MDKVNPIPQLQVGDVITVWHDDDERSYQAKINSDADLYSWSGYEDKIIFITRRVVVDGVEKEVVVWQR